MDRVTLMLLLLTATMVQSDMKLGKCSGAEGASDANFECENQQADFDSVSLLQHKATLKITQSSDSHLGVNSTATSLLSSVKHLAELDVEGELKENGVTAAVLDAIIKQMTDGVIAGVMKEHTESQNEMQSAADKVSNCGDVMKSSFARSGDGVDALKGKMKTAKATMYTCRSAQKAELDASTAACDALYAFLAGVFAKKPGCLTSTPAKGKEQEACFDATLAWVDPVRDAFLKMKAACKDATATLDARKPTCDIDQSTFESDFCSYNQELTKTCHAYTTCHTSTTGEFGETKKAVAAAEEAGKAEFTAAKKVICYVGVLKAKKAEKKGALKKCNELAIDTTVLDITYPDAPAAQTCDTSPVDVKPCDAGLPFYANQPWFAAAPPKTCTPCPAVALGAGDATLILQAAAGSNTFEFNSAYWTTTQTLNPSQTTAAVGVDAKLSAFNTLKAKALKVCTGTSTASMKCFEYQLQDAEKTALELFSGSEIRTPDIDQKKWEEVFGHTDLGHQGSPNNCGMQRPGFNTKCRDNNWARWGYCDNIPSQGCQPLENHDADRAIGIGLKGQSSSKGSAGVQGYPGQDRYGKSLQMWLYSIPPLTPTPAPPVDNLPKGVMVSAEDDKSKVVLVPIDSSHTGKVCMETVKATCDKVGLKTACHLKGGVHNNAYDDCIWLANQAEGNHNSWFQYTYPESGPGCGKTFTSKWQCDIWGKKAAGSAVNGPTFTVASKGYGGCGVCGIYDGAWCYNFNAGLVNGVGYAVCAKSK